MSWNYNNPKFECDEVNRELLRYAPWSGHRNFIYDFMEFFKPKTVVELGSHYGCSSFAIGQAIKDKKLDCVFYGVDTWEGDDFTQVNQGEDVFTNFKRVRDNCYSEDYLKMLRMTFDEAVDKFEDNSVDLLHIDGSHYYEDAKHDFNFWKLKLKKDAIVLFHDVSADKMFGEVMGSHIYWQEIKKEYPYTYDFDFSYGLGILFFSKEKYDAFTESADGAKYQRINNSLAEDFKDELRKAYFKAKDDKFYIDDLLKQRAVLNEQIDKYKENEEKKNDYISELENDRVKINSELKSIVEKYEKTQKETAAEYERSQKEIIESYEKTQKEMIAEYEKAQKEIIERYEKTQKETAAEYEKTQKETVAEYEKTIAAKDEYIRELIKNNEMLEMQYSKTLRYKLSKTFNK